jgi:RNA polymerase sigma factor (sigma-70 family)
MPNELFEKYECDRDRLAYERLLEAHRPLVTSVCRRLLRDPNDIEDVVQETFLKLAGHIHSVTGSMAAWLTATAHAASVDLIRREISQRNRRDGLAHIAGAAQERPAPEYEIEHLATREAIRLHLHDAMLEMDPAARELLTARFGRKTPLGAIAIQLKVSVPTASRRVAQAIAQLAEILRDMGVHAADDRAVADEFGDVDSVGAGDEGKLGGLRFALDWRCAELTPLGVANPTSFPGWSRPMRVGVLVSYESTRIIGINRAYVGTKWQVHSATFFPQDGLQLVGVVEPGTVHRGIVESTVRDYGILGGLIEADDTTALETLDVLLLGINYAITPPIARAINRAVRAGMGLLNEYWTGTHVGICDDACIRELMLAGSNSYKYHMPGECGDPMPATVLREHPLLPGLNAGSKIQVRGCGPVYKVMPTAQVLIAKDYFVQPREHGLHDLGPMQMPCYILGQLGRGRIVVNHIWPHQWFIRELHIGCEAYFTNLLRWLAWASSGSPE